MPFLCAEVPTTGLVLPAYTRKHDGLVADFVLASSRSTPSGLAHTQLVRLEGAAPAVEQAILADLRRTYGVEPRVERRDGTTLVTLADLKPGSPAGMIMRLQHEHCLPWAEVRNGRIRVRGPIVGSKEAAIEAVSSALSKTGIDAKVTARKLTPAQTERWEELRGLALRTGPGTAWQRVEKILAARLAQ